MTNQHSITPPPELVRHWSRFQGDTDSEALWFRIANEASQWGADQELEACVEWLGDAPIVYNDNGDLHPGSYLRDARRPKPPSLKEEAMQALCRFMAGEGHDDCTEEEIEDDFKTIRRALEALDD
jgi:hypothetical protein